MTDIKKSLGSFSHQPVITPNDSGTFTVSPRGLQIKDPETSEFTVFEIICETRIDVISELCAAFDALPLGTVIKSYYHHNAPHEKREEGYVPLLK